MIVTFKYLCEECTIEVNLSDDKCPSNLCPSLYLKTKSIKCYKVTYSASCFFFNRKSEFVKMPSVSFKSMREKERWIVNAKAELRLKHCNKQIPSNIKLERKAKIITFISNSIVDALEKLVSKNKK